jgi:hypothetical protein
MAGEISRLLADSDCLLIALLLNRSLNWAQLPFLLAVLSRGVRRVVQWLPPLGVIAADREIPGSRTPGDLSSRRLLESGFRRKRRASGLLGGLSVLSAMLKVGPLVIREKIYYAAPKPGRSVERFRTITLKLGSPLLSCQQIHLPAVCLADDCREIVGDALGFLAG